MIIIAWFMEALLLILSVSISIRAIQTPDRWTVLPAIFTVACMLCGLWVILAIRP